MATQPLVSIIIVTYNSAAYIDTCLRSVMASAYWPFEVVVVDNNSTDETIKLVNKVGKDYPKPALTVHQLKDNLGYAEANNIGANLAKGKYLFILNPDTVVDAHFLIDLVAEAQMNPRLAVAQPAVYLLKNSQQLNLTGKETHYLGFDWIKNYQSTALPPNQVIHSFSGSGFLILASLFNGLGGFDPKYFMYYEDTDLSWRIELAGYQIKFINSSQLYHDYKYEPDESYQTMRQKLFWAERNRVITVLKNYSKKTLLVLAPALLLLEVSMLVFATLSGWGREKVKTYQEISQLWPHLRQQRQRVQRLRTKTDRQIMLQMQSTITFAQFNHPVIKYLLNPIFAIYYQVALLLV
jgi:GT2 family glycosyltransferase